MKNIKLKKLTELDTRWIDSPDKRKLLQLLAPFKVEVRFTTDKGRKCWDVVVINTGFITNSASTPKCLRNIISPFGSVRASVLHDFLYDTKIYNRKDCDEVFLVALKTLDHRPKWKRAAAYSAVRMFASSNYGNE